MRKINKRVLVAALSLLLISCAFVTVLSFTLAAGGDREGTKTVSADPSFDVVTIYNIDRIVENSNTGSDPKFHIVEVSSSGNFSAMSGSNTSKVFTDYVFNGYKTIEQSMAEGMIDYKPFSTVSMSDTNIRSCVEALVKADLIYVHNDSGNYFGKSGNDLPEAVKLQLCSSATSDYVPFIIDGPIATQEIISSNTSSYSELVTKEFKRYGGRKYTYQWNTETQGTALQFFTHETSAYIQIDGKTIKDKWTKVYDIEDYDLSNIPEVETATNSDAPATNSDAELEDEVDRTKEYYSISDETSTIGRILVINGSASDGVISNLVKDSITEFTGKVILEEDAKGIINAKDKDEADVRLIEKMTTEEGVAVPPIYNVDNVKLYSVPVDSGLYNAYISRNDHPDYMSFEYYAGKDPALDTIDYSLYDMIIVEKGPYGENDLSAENYTKLTAAMNGNQHILYDSALVGVISTGGGDIDYGDNYDYVCGKVMTSTEAPKYESVLVTSKSRMDAYMAAENKEAVKDIADIINYASYRGIGGGNNDSSNTYTVLEIQPAYPIDLKLATLFAKIDGTTHIKGKVDPLENNPYKANMTFASITGRTQPFDRSTGTTAGNSWYYIRNQGVINNSTTDEISFDNGATSLTTFLESGNNITSDQLKYVTDYYAWKLSKAKIAHITGLSYDQVNVVHMSTYEFNCSKKTVLDNYDFVYIGGDNSAFKNVSEFDTSRLSSIGHKVYNMYFCDGDAYPYNATYGNDKGSVGTFIGNDITESKYNELDAYRTNKMPIIIDKDAVSGYGRTDAIDPNSRMFKFISQCETDVINGKKNIVWNFNYDDIVKISNADESYGKTVENFVTVFGGTETTDYIGEQVKIDSSSINENSIKDCLNNSAKRPKLVLTDYPDQYKEKDSSTWRTDHNLRWSYEAAGGSDFTARLYIDDNANSRFEDDEVVSTNSGSKGNLSKKLDSDYFGVVYWKVEIENGDGCKSSTTGCLKVMRQDQNKIRVNLLQIMPDAAVSGGDNAAVTLLLCTECQQARHVLYGNRYASVGKYEPSSVLGLNNRFVDGASYTSSYLSDPYESTGAITNVDATNGALRRIENYLINARTNDGNIMYLDGLMPDYDITYDGTISWSGADRTGYEQKEFGAAVPGGRDWTNTINVNNFGYHEHKFGIVRYDSTMTSGSYTGIDDWTQNWFDQVSDDYEVYMNILYLSDFEKMTEDIKNKYSSLTTEEQIKTLRQKYSQASTEFFDAYSGMVKVINGTYNNSVANGGLTNKEKTALQKYLCSFKGFGLGKQVGDNQKIAIQADAQREVEKLDPAITDETKKNEWINKYVEDRCNEILYSTFDDVVAEFAASGADIEDFLTKAVANGAGIKDKISAADLAKEVAYVLSYDEYDDRPYYDLFSLTKDTNGNSQGGTYDMKTYSELYAKWRDAKMYEQFFRKMYEYFAIFTCVDDNGKVDLTRYYNCMVFGPAEKFAGADMTSDVAIDAVIDYIENGGQTMLFYDTLTASSTINMTNRLGEYFGINTKSSDRSGGSQNPVKLSYREATGAKTFNGDKYPSLMFDYTIYVGAANATDEGHTHPDKNLYSMAVDNKVETNTALQNNEGIVTMYPFAIDNNLRISPTEESDFTLNVESDNLIVYYSLSGGTTGTISSGYVADPLDGANNYFVYQYQPKGNNAGMVTYLGAGRSQVTGTTRENNDERRFFINLILNTGRKSTKSTAFNIYDASSTQIVSADGTIGASSLTNKTVLEDGAISYKMTILEGSVPEFSYLVTTDPKVEVAEVWAYYDLDYDETKPDDEYYNNDKHVLVYNKEYNKSGTYSKTTNPWIASEYLAWVDKDTALKSTDATVVVNGVEQSMSMLEVKDNYLYQNEYTYIVVKIVDTKGNPYYKRIKIIIKPELHELT